MWLRKRRQLPPPHEPGVLLRRIAQQDVSDVIAGGTGRRAFEFADENYQKA